MTDILSNHPGIEKEIIKYTYTKESGSAHMHSGTALLLEDFQFNPEERINECHDIFDKKSAWYKQVKKILI